MKAIIFTLITLLIGLSISGWADDTDLYLNQVGQISPTDVPNVLFVLDRSGSMNSKDEGSLTRLERMQEALISLLDQITNINVGFMTFSGQPPRQGRDDDAVVPVRFPVTYIDELLGNVPGEQGLPSSYQSESHILSSTDDAEQGVVSGEVVLEEAILEATYPSGADMTPGKTVVSLLLDNADDAREFLSNEGSQPKGKVYATRNNWIALGGSSYGEVIVGLRFPKVAVPQGATIKDAQIVFTSQEDNANPLDLLIQGVKQVNPRSFQESYYDISDHYPTTDQSVKWLEVSAWKKEKNYATPNLAKIVQEMIDQPKWTTGHAMAFRLTRTPSAYLPNNRRRFKTAGEGEGPLLRITYEAREGILGAGNFDYVTTITQQISSTENDAHEFRGGGAGSYNMTPGTVVTDKYTRLGDGYCKKNKIKCRGEVLAGYRFSDLNIPQGATITYAAIKFVRRSTSGDNEHDPLNLTIYAENNRFAPTFRGKPWKGQLTSDLSSRSRVPISVPWNQVPDLEKYQ